MASNGAKGFDWPGFWKKWGHLQGTKIDFLALMASDRDNPISGDWLEQWLRDEIRRRRAAAAWADSGQNGAKPGPANEPSDLGAPSANPHG